MSFILVREQYILK